MTCPWFYPDKVSVMPGETVTIFASAPASPCRLVIARVGSETVEVAAFDEIEVENHPTPEKADTSGCGWPAAFSFEIPGDWAPGYYDLVLVDPNGAESRHFVCVKRRADASPADAVIVLSTNTYAAYNYWGGSNAYANVEALMSGELTADESRSGAIGSLSRHRPYPQGLIAPPPGVPRLINQNRRGLNERPFPGEREWNRAYTPSPYDSAAGFIDKWEHAFVTWAENNGLRLDYLTDHDFVTGDEDLLSDYKAALVVGHSEYWSGAQRKAFERYVDNGGHFVVFSGNTAYWKVRWEDGGDTLAAHKWRGHLDDPLWASDSTRDEATHLWSHEAFEKPEAALTGLSFLYGGYHRLGMCVARGAAGFTIYDNEHWALENTDLYYGDVLGSDIPLIGYENDGCPIQFGDDGLPKPGGGVGIPENLEIIGLAPATLFESDESPFPKIIPMEEADVLARVAYGKDTPKTIHRLTRGHAVMASFKRNAGEVFNAGTTEWAHGLAAGDPFVDKITRNVLTRFGVEVTPA